MGSFPETYNDQRKPPFLFPVCFRVHAFSIPLTQLSWTLEQDKNESVIANWRGDISTIML